VVCSGTLHQRFAAASFANLEPIPTAVGAQQRGNVLQLFCALPGCKLVYLYR